MSNNISFKLNDFQYTINNKLTVIQACLKNKVDVPRFCFHERLSIAGNCRMCLIEDIKQVKPIASCAVNISPNMSIYTNTIKVKKARESVLEFLLANHPLDCPICDQGGECDLQDQSLVFGSDRGRFYEFKRSVEDKDCGPLIKTIMNRCIHCTRCVRFSNEVAGVNILGVTGRGSKMEIGFYIENLMRSEISGNIIDLCPVGALTSKPFAFTSRPWELRSYNTIDVLDSMHSNIRVDVRGTKIMRVLPRVNSSINEDWITDKIRFSYDAFRRQRLFDPMVFIKNSFIKLSWRRSIYFLKNVFINYLNFSNVSRKNLPLNSYIDEDCDVETLHLLRKILSLSGSLPFHGYNISFDNSVFYSFNSKLENLNETDFSLIVDLNLRLSLPLLNAKLRQVVLKKNLPSYLIGYNSNFTFYIKHISISSKSILNICEGTHWLSFKISKQNSFKPLLLLNSDSLGFFNTGWLKNSTNLISNNWLGLNVVSDSGSHYALNEIGLSNFFSNDNFRGISYLINYNKPFNFELSYFTVYQGHHGDSSALNANLIFPSTSFIEKNSFYLNVFGMLQKSKKVLFNVGNSRDDWKILNAIYEIFNYSEVKFQNSFNLISDISKITPIILYRRNFFLFENNYFLKALFYLKTFKSRVNNFYLTDSITRNSKIMSLCYNRFKLSSYNF